MTYGSIKEVLDELGVRYSYRHFNGPIREDKYIVFYETDKNRFLADDKVYAHDSSFAIEFYSKLKDPETEEKLISLFDAHEIVWSSGEETWLQQEKVFMTPFYC